MSLKKIRPEEATALGALFVAIVLGAWVGYSLSSRSSRNSAIQNECAHYDMRTGEFRWGSPQ